MPQSTTGRPPPQHTPGFNPQSLSDAAPPAAGAQPWQWLAQRAADPVERAANQWFFERLEQDLVIGLDGAPHITLRLSPATRDEAAGPFPFPGPVAVISTVPLSALAVQALDRELREELQEHLGEHRIGHRPTVAADRGQRWGEHELIVDYTDTELVRFAARLRLRCS